MKKLIFSTAVIAVISATTLPVSVSAHGGASGIVKERMDAMGMMGDAVKALKDMMQGKADYDATNRARAGFYHPKTCRRRADSRRFLKAHSINLPKPNRKSGLTGSVSLRLPSSWRILPKALALPLTMEFNGQGMMIWYEVWQRHGCHDGRSIFHDGRQRHDGPDDGG